MKTANTIATLGARRRAVALAGLLAACLLVAACGSSKKTGTVSPTGSGSASWSFPGADLQNTRHVGGPIDSSNVGTLGVAWTVPLTATGTFGAYATTPVVIGGVMYTQDIASNVQAINVKSGAVLWTHSYNSPDEGPNGVNVVNGTIYGATGTSAFALAASTGKQLWIKTLVRNANEGIDMAPGVNGGTVYVSTVPGNTTKFYSGSGQAILWAMDASTGATKWKWEEVPANLWSAAHTNINSGGGQWYPPSFDSEGNLYLGVSNPAPFAGTLQFPWGSSRPGPDLYTDSIVKLNAQTGKLIWYYQLTPHDLYDRDMQNSPILANANGRQIVIDGGKAGFLVAVNAQTGKLIWKRAVGVHNGHDNDNLIAERGEFSRLHTPETVEPGDLGGMESQLASNGRTVFAAVNNLAAIYKGQGLSFVSFAPLNSGTGDLVAVNEATGNVEWDHKLPSSPYGAATLANDVLFTTTFNGTLYAFNANTGKEIWHTMLSANTNAPVAVAGDTVLAAASFPSSAAQKALIIAYRLGAKGALPTPAAPTTAPSTTPGKTTAPTVTKSTTAASTVNLGTMGYMLMFSQGQATAKAGKVTLQFTNNSALEHDVVLTSASNTILGQTPIFRGGTKSFTLKLAPGTYTYYCSVPGHRQAGMQGTLTVK
jgi:outer membrane protein assembly factor BamB/plastocyanin